MNRTLVFVRLKNSISTTFCLLGLTLIPFGESHGQIFTDQSEELGVTAVIDGHEFGSGLSTYDFDRDGLDDITLCNSNGSILVYRNESGSFNLTNMQLLVAGDSKSVIWVDYDNDGLLDLFVTTFLGQNILYRNQGDFNFAAVTSQAGLPVTPDHNAGACFGDYNRDGYLDLYICKYANNFTNPPVSSDHYNKLYLNNGDGTFSDVTLEAGVQEIPSLSLQSTWVDINQDSWPDLFVINDRMPGNFLFLNNTDGTFTNVTDEYDVSYPANCVMSNSVADFDQDGDLDIFMTNAGGPTTPNIMLVNQGDFFDDMAEQLNLSMFEFAWGGVWLDANNDSWEDLYVVLPGDSPNHLYLNASGEDFTDSPDEISVSQEYTSYAPAKGDFNNDGYADVAIQCIFPNHSYVMMNAGGDKSYIKYTLQGTASNKEAIGTWVKMYFGDQQTSHYTLCGENYHGQNSQHHLYGLGGTQTVDSVSVLYPSGHKDIYYNLAADSSYYFVEGDTYTADITSITGTYSFCEGDSLQLDAGIHQSYLWSNGDSSRFTTVHDSGFYQVTVMNEYGVSTTAQIEIMEHPLPQITSIINPNLCYGDSTGSISLINQSGIEPDSVIWNDELIGNPLGEIPSGTYFYYFTDVNGCSANGQATIVGPPAADFLISTTPETDNQSDGTISISAFGGTPPFEFFLNDEIVSSPITELEGGTYEFVVFDANMCQSTLTITVDEVLHVNKANSSELKIFPNPAQEQIHILTQEPIRRIEIQTIEGRMALSLEKSMNDMYDLSGLSKGLYVVQLYLEDGTIKSRRIAKNK